MVPDNSETSREIMNAEACLSNQKTLARIASEIEKHNTLLLTSLEDRRGAVITCPSIDVPDFTDKIALALEEKGIVACKATDDSNDVSQIIQPYEKSYTSDKHVFTHSSGHHSIGGKSNDIPGQRDEVWDDTNEEVLTVSNGKTASLTTSSKSYPLNDSNLNYVTENSSSDSERSFKTERSTGNSAESTSENSVSQIQEQHSNSSQRKWNNIVAIIHDTDTGGSEEEQKPAVTIIHEKSSEEKATEFSSFHIPDAVHDQHDSNTTLLTRIPTEQEIQVIAFLRKPDDDDETAEKENGSNVIRRSMNYTDNSKNINTTVLAQEMNHNASLDNSRSMTTSGNREHVKQNDATEPAITVSTEAGNSINASTVIKSEDNVTSNESYNLEMNFTKSAPNTVEQEDNAELYVSEFMKKIMETYGTDIHVNKSIQDFWKVLLEKNHHLKTDRHSVENRTSAEVLDTSKEEPNENSSYDDDNDDDYVNYKNLEFRAHRLNTSNIPETMTDVKIKQYVNKLEEIAQELSNRKESSLNNNTVGTMNYTHILTEQEYLPAQLTEEDDTSSY